MKNYIYSNELEENVPILDKEQNILTIKIIRHPRKRYKYFYATIEAPGYMKVRVSQAIEKDKSEWTELDKWRYVQNSVLPVINSTRFNSINDALFHATKIYYNFYKPEGWEMKVHQFQTFDEILDANVDVLKRLKYV